MGLLTFENQFESMQIQKKIKSILQKNGYTDSVICLHASLKSFGDVKNSPDTIINAFLAAGNTLLAPAFYYASEAAPPNKNYKRNGIDYSHRVFSPTNYTGLWDQIEPAMGAIPKTMLRYKNAFRSSHPMNSFVAIGPDAEHLIHSQENLNVYAAYKQILTENKRAYIFLCGTRLISCTPIHFAEEVAGRVLFRRWAMMNDTVNEVEVGACSTGFEKLRPFVKDIEHKLILGNSITSVFLFREFIERTAAKIKDNPEITKCSENCLSCKDIIAGGTDFSEPASK
jgi:aminoglycoside 3-N-acetyltransferase